MVFVHLHLYGEPQVRNYGVLRKYMQVKVARRLKGAASAGRFFVVESGDGALPKRFGTFRGQQWHPQQESVNSRGCVGEDRMVE